MSGWEGAGQTPSPAGRPLLRASILITLFSLLGALSAWPIYRTDTLWLTVAGATIAALALAAARLRFRWRPSTLLIAASLTLVGLIVPLGVPTALTGGPRAWASALAEGLAGIILGWKQLLTLTLPVGDYRAVLVPLLVTVFVSALAAAVLATTNRRLTGWAVLPLALPIVFGTVFGAAETSSPLSLGPLTLPAPREVGICALAFVLALLWVRAHSGAPRTGPGRDAPGGLTRPGLIRAGAACGVLTLAALVALTVAPIAAGQEDRRVPRDRIDPELVVRERPSPLSGYRTWFRDDRFSAPLFEVETTSPDPLRLSLAVLGRFDGAEFSVGDSDTPHTRFTRFPGGTTPEDPVTVDITVAEGYGDIWVPLPRGLTAPPDFSGPRAEALSDGFYLNRETGTAIAVPTEAGLRAGDRITARVAVSPERPLTAGPKTTEPLIDLDTMPELAGWISAQAQPQTAAGLTELIDRIRARGYLSHALDIDPEGARWLDELRERGGGRFLPSYAGHSAARIETLFAEAREQERAAGPDAEAPALVAPPGDDEQFATAAALLARALGYESRVVLGFRVDPGSTTPELAVPACVDRCTGAMVTAWAEIRGNDDRWVALDASPQWQHAPSELSEGERLPEYATVPREPSAKDTPPPLGLGDNDDAPAPPGPEPDAGSALWHGLRIAGLWLIVGLLVALPLLFIPVAKVVRARQRRRLGHPESRAVAAWAELVDRLRDSGRFVPEHGSRLAIAEHLDDPLIESVAVGVERAIFSDAPISETEADGLWELVDQVTAERNAELSPLARVRAAATLRSLRVRPGNRNRRRFWDRSGDTGRELSHGTIEQREDRP